MIINYDFEMDHHTRICFGAGKIKTTGAEVKKYGSRVFIITDKGLKNLGIVEKAIESIKHENMKCTVYDDVMLNPRDTGCDAAAEQGKDFQADVILGIGGGSSMDTAKAVSVLMSNGGDCLTWSKVRKFPKPIIPVICIPTTSGTGSEVTFEAVITAEKVGKKVSISDGSKMAPKLAIMDPELTISIPSLITASTGMDALTHALEAYTCKYAQPVSDGLAEYAMKKIAGSIVKATKKGSDIQARQEMMIGSMMAGMAFINSFLGAVHAISETLGGYYDIPHGIANSIFLPYVTEYNMDIDHEKHAVVAKCLGVETHELSDKEASEAGVKKLFQLNEVLGIPKFGELEQVKPADFEEVAELCNVHPCGAKANPRAIKTEDYINILKKAYGA